MIIFVEVLRIACVELFEQKEGVPLWFACFFVFKQLYYLSNFGMKLIFRFQNIDKNYYYKPIVRELPKHQQFG